MAEEKTISIGEMRKTIATSLGTAFGLVIGLLWNQVVQGGLALANVHTTAPADPIDFLFFILSAVVVTVVMVIFIVVVGRWGGKGQKA